MILYYYSIGRHYLRPRYRESHPFICLRMKVFHDVSLMLLKAGSGLQKLKKCRKGRRRKGWSGAPISSMLYCVLSQATWTASVLCTSLNCVPPWRYRDPIKHQKMQNTFPKISEDLENPKCAKSCHVLIVSIAWVDFLCLDTLLVFCPGVPSANICSQEAGPRRRVDRCEHARHGPAGYLFEN